jgi:hypothetical protein
MLIALPRLLKWNRPVTNLMTIMGLGTAAYSLMTRYELGTGSLPMRVHLALDGLNGALFCAAPALFPNESAPVLTALTGIGMFEVAASLTTDPETSEDKQPQGILDRFISR